MARDDETVGVDTMRLTLNGSLPWSGRLAVRVLLSLGCCSALVVPGCALASDDQDLPPPPVSVRPNGVIAFGQEQDLSQPCAVKAPTHPINLVDALYDAMCSDPRTRQSWAALQAQAAQVGQARAAFWPKLDASVDVNRDRVATTVGEAPIFSSDLSSHFRTQALALSWTLFDFGSRSDAAKSALDLLRSTQYNLDEDLQATLLSTAKDYESAEAAASALDAMRQDAVSAQQSLTIARARMDRGVAPISDVLQAQTAFAQASADAIHAEGSWRSSLGRLGIDMGLDPQATSLQLVPVSPDIGALESSDRSMLDLLAMADRLNPKINAARAQRLAAVEHAASVRADGLPNLRLNWKYSSSTQPVSEGLGLPQLGAATREDFIGVEVEIPIFDGFGQRWREREATAKAQEEEAAIADARQQVMRGVWTGYQDYRTAETDVRSTDTVLAVAQQALQAAQRRYQFGVTGILELLSAQTALSKARREHLQALTDWMVARLTLANAVGVLGATVDDTGRERRWLGSFER